MQPPTSAATPAGELRYTLSCAGRLTPPPARGTLPAVQLLALSAGLWRGDGADLAGGHVDAVSVCVCVWGGGCGYQPKLNQTQPKVAEHRQRRQGEGSSFHNPEQANPWGWG